MQDLQDLAAFNGRNPWIVSTGCAVAKIGDLHLSYINNPLRNQKKTQLPWDWFPLCSKSTVNRKLLLHHKREVTLNCAGQLLHYGGGACLKIFVELVCSSLYQLVSY